MRFYAVVLLALNPKAGLPLHQISLSLYPYFVVMWNIILSMESREKY